MSQNDCISITAPYLLFIGDIDSKVYAKTALGMVQWCPSQVAGQLRFKDNPLDLGVPDIPLEQAIEAGIKSLIIGVAPVGGNVDDRWIKVLVDAASRGLDIVSGLHLRLEDWPALKVATEESGAQLINVRVPPKNLPIGNGIKRSGKRVLMVGTDCAVGKKYTALALTDSLRALSVDADFRATGQTGIMIAGAGIPIDSVVSDFVSGAAEIISPDNKPNHWDVIEGQGSLFNPSYAGVSLGLLHGSQPDALVVCHDAIRTVMDSCPHLSTPDINRCVDWHIQCAQQTNPQAVCVGVSVNTSGLPVAEREAYKQKIAVETGLPCVDSVIDGCDAIAQKILKTYPQSQGSLEHA